MPSSSSKSHTPVVRPKSKEKARAKKSTATSSSQPVNLKPKAAAQVQTLGSIAKQAMKLKNDILNGARK